MKRNRLTDVAAAAAGFALASLVAWIGSAEVIPTRPEPAPDAAFVAPDEVRGRADERLRILTTLPKGTVHWREPVVVVFSRPMVPAAQVGLPAAKVPVTLAPAVAGEWRWVTPGVAEFRPDKPWPDHAEVRATVAAGTKDAEGAKLVDAVSWGFRRAAPRRIAPPTGAPAVAATTPQDESGPLPPELVQVVQDIGLAEHLRHGRIVVSLLRGVPTDELLRRFSLTGPDGVRVPIRLVSAPVDAKPAPGTPAARVRPVARAPLDPGGLVDLVAALAEDGGWERVPALVQPVAAERPEPPAAADSELSRPADNETADGPRTVLVEAVNPLGVGCWVWSCPQAMAAWQGVKTTRDIHVVGDFDVVFVRPDPENHDGIDVLFSGPVSVDAIATHAGAGKLTLRDAAPAALGGSVATTSLPAIRPDVSTSGDGRATFRADLLPGREYELVIAPGLQDRFGNVLAREHRHRFRTVDLLPSVDPVVESLGWMERFGPQRLPARFRNVPKVVVRETRLDAAGLLTHLPEVGGWNGLFKENRLPVDPDGSALVVGRVRERTLDTASPDQSAYLSLAMDHGEPGPRQLLRRVRTWAEGRHLGQTTAYGAWKWGLVQQGLESLDRMTYSVGRPKAVYLEMTAPGTAEIVRRLLIQREKALGRNIWEWKRDEIRDSHAGVVVLVTDIGLTVKSSPAGTLVWASSLSTGRPMAGVKITAHDTAGKELWTRHTDASGVSEGPGDRNASGDAPRMRWLLAAGPDGDLAVADMQDGEAGLWRFGLRSRGHSDGTTAKGLMFADRDLYRPGETAHLRAVVRLDGRNGPVAPPAGKRVELVVKDNHERPVFRRELTTSAYGTVHADVTIPADARVGTWTAQLSDIAGESILPAHHFRVAEFRPQEAEAKLRLDGAGPHFLSKPLDVAVEGRWLFGAPMAGADVTVSWWSDPMSGFAPPGAEGFVFGPRVTGEQPYLSGESKGKLDASGRVVVSVTPSGTSRLNVPVRLMLDARIDDPSGRGVSAHASTVLHPAGVMVGVVPPPYLLEAGKPAEVKLAAFLPQGGRTSLAGVAVRAVSKRWATVNKRGAGGSLRTESEPVTRVIAEQTVDLPATGEGTPFTFTPDRTGEIEIVAEGRDADGITVTTVTGAWVIPAGRGGSEHGRWGGWRTDDEDEIRIVADRKSYRPGETAKLMLQLPFAMTAVLVTLERSGVMERRVVPVSGDTAVVEFPLTDAHGPNVYVSAVGVRGRRGFHATEWGHDLGKPRVALGYVELPVSTEARRLAVEVKPSVVVTRPGSELAVDLTVRDAAGRPTDAEVSVAVVDEGVLSLLGTRTPDPHAALHRPAELSVTSRDTRYNLLSTARVDEFGHKAYAGGGGAGGNVFGGGTGKDGGPQFDPWRDDFASCAHWTPAVATDAQGRARVTVKLPHNLTRWRVMAVAVGRDNRTGSGQATVEAHKPLQVRPSLPRFLHEGDAFQLAATVHSEHPTPQKVRVRVEVQGLTFDPKGFHLWHEGTLTPADGGFASQGRESSAAEFDVDVPARGSALFRVPVSASRTKPGDKAVRVRMSVVAHGAPEPGDQVAMTLPVRRLTDERRFAEHGVLTSGGWVRALRLPDAGVIAPETRKVRLVMSASPLSELGPGLHYLLQYPYGCIEQTTSSYLPLAGLQGLLPALGADAPDEATVKRLLKAGVARALSMQQPSGGFAYWPGGREVVTEGTLYALHGLLEAKAAGAEVDESALRRAADWMSRSLRGTGAQFADTEDDDGVATGGGSQGPTVEGDASGTGPALMRERRAMTATEAAEALRGRPLAKRTPRELSAGAWALWLLARSGRAEPAYAAEFVRQAGRMDVEGLSLLVLAVAEGPAAARADLQRLSGELLTRLRRTTFGKELPHVQVPDADAAGVSPGDVGFHTSVRPVALALTAMLRTQPDLPMVTVLGRRLLELRRGPSWANTQDNAWALPAVAAWVRVLAASPVHVTVTASGAGAVSGREMLLHDGQLSVAGGKVELDLTALAAASERTGKDASASVAQLRLTRDGVSPVYWRLEVSGIEPAPPALPSGSGSAGLTVWRTVEPLQRREGSDGSAGDLRVGDLVRVRLTVVSDRLRHWVAIADRLPAGLEAVDTDFVTESETARRAEIETGDELPAGDGVVKAPELRWVRMTARPDHRELLDHGVRMFADVLHAGVHEFVYVARATTAGDHRHPPATVEDMYRPEDRFRTAGGDLRIVAPEARPARK